MVKMRIKIDVWSQGLHESKREEIRDHLRDIYCGLPARRVWFYLKHIRNMHVRSDRLLGTQFNLENVADGPEDGIANGKYPFPADVGLCRC
jgi:hypothetical protein